MIRVEMTTTIKQPIERVFDYVSDFSTLPEYDRYVVSCRQLSKGEIGVGTTWTHERVQGRRRIVAPIKLVEFERNKRFVMRSGSGPFDVTSTCTFEAIAADETRMVEILEMRLSGFLRLMEPMIRRQVGPQGREVHAALKEKLEAPAQTAGC